MKTLRNNVKIVGYVFQLVPIYPIVSFFYIISSSITKLAGVMVVERVIVIVAAENMVFSNVVKELVIYTIVITLCLFYTAFYRYYMRSRCRHVWVKKMQHLMYEKAKSLDIEYFDDPVKYDQISRSLKEGDLKGINSYDSFVFVLESFFSVCSLAGYILLRLPFLFIVVFIQAILSYWIYSKYNKLRYRQYKELESNERYHSYIERTFYLEKNAIDVKTTVLPTILLEKNKALYEEQQAKWRKTEWKTMFLQTAETLLYDMVSIFFTYSYLMYLVYYKGLQVSVFASMINAVITFVGGFYGLARNLVNLQENALYIEDLLWLLKYCPRMEGDKGKKVDFTHPTIELKSVSFRYPSVEEDTLKNINLTIHPHEKIAIIGYNGAGKTTLTKLLFKFYPPSSGMLYLDSESYEDLSKQSIRNCYGLILQNFQVYAVSIAENILMRKKEGPEDEEIVWGALQKVGLEEKVRNLPEKIDTLLTKEFSNHGLELSGGERQRLAIARIFASNAPIIVLDEPTSALDPLAEATINEEILELCKEKTIILISHRLSTVVHTDKIYLMKNGEIVESGTHETLMEQKGIYHEMFMAQAKYYLSSSSNKDEKVA